MYCMSWCLVSLHILMYCMSESWCIACLVYIACLDVLSVWHILMYCMSESWCIACFHVLLVLHILMYCLSESWCIACLVCFACLDVLSVLHILMYCMSESRCITPLYVLNVLSVLHILMSCTSWYTRWGTCAATIRRAKLYKSLRLGMTQLWVCIPVTFWPLWWRVTSR